MAVRQPLLCVPRSRHVAGLHDKKPCRLVRMAGLRVRYGAGWGVNRTG